MLVWEAADTQLLSLSPLQCPVVPSEFSVPDRCWQGSLNPSVQLRMTPGSWRGTPAACHSPSSACVPSVLQYCWRWTGFNFGLDLLVTYTNRYIIFKRNTLNQPCSGSVSLQPRRSIAFRCSPGSLRAASPAGTAFVKKPTLAPWGKLLVLKFGRLKCFGCCAPRLRLASFDCSGKMICSRTTGYQILTLEKDQVCLWA